MGNNRSLQPFILLHYDIWGKYSTLSTTGAHYFLTIIDDYSHCLWVYLMHNKFKTYPILVSFYAIVKTQLNYQVKEIHTNNGNEFLSNCMQSFFSNNGIIHQWTYIDTPQQNGVVERKHRHILEVARALRFHAHLSIFSWGECTLTIAYLINCIPTSVLDGKSPYEVLFGKKPSYDHL